MTEVLVSNWQHLPRNTRLSAAARPTQETVESGAEGSIRGENVCVQEEPHLLSLCEGFDLRKVKSLRWRACLSPKVTLEGIEALRGGGEI